MWTRRRFLEFGAWGLAAATSARARRAISPPVARSDGRLTARPTTPTGAAEPGRRRLGIGGARDGLLYVPSGYSAATPGALVLMLHGADGTAEGGSRPFEGLADAHGLILLAPESRGASWDVRYGEFGVDVEFIDRALREVFRTCRVDPARVFIEGFSDGASYALSLGLTNGDLFSRVIAFSPGFMRVKKAYGTPAVFVAHGTRDAILPIEDTSRRLVPSLRRIGYAVRFREFDGGHMVPPAIAREAVEWLEGKGAG